MMMDEFFMWMTYVGIVLMIAGIIGGMFTF